MVNGMLRFMYDHGVQNDELEKDEKVSVQDRVSYYVALYIIADKYDVPDLHGAVIEHLQKMASSFVGDPAKLDDLLTVLFSPTQMEPAHCLKAIAHDVSQSLANENNVRTLMGDELFRLKLHNYGDLAASCAVTLKDLLTTEENKMGNIRAVACMNANCTNFRRRWTYKHGPRGGNVIRHCIWCGQTNLTDLGQ